MKSILVFPLPLMSKGERILVLLVIYNSFLQLAEINTIMVSIKSKGGDCWHYDTSVVLDGNSLIGQFSFGKRQLIIK